MIKINASFLGGGLASVVGLGTFSAFASKIKFESFSGASIGSVIAACLAAGKSPEEIREFWADNVEDFCTFILGNQKIERKVDEFLDVMLFRDLPKECLVSITPLRKEIPMVITRENSEDLTVGEVVALSSALPGYYLPGFVKLCGKYAFVLDGGLILNPPLNPNAVNFIFGKKLDTDKWTARLPWNQIQLEQEKNATYVRTVSTKFGTFGKRDDVFAVYQEGFEYYKKTKYKIFLETLL